MEIIKLIPSFIRNLLFKGHERSVKAKKNIIMSFSLQGIGILISLLQVPLTLSYVDSTRYGIWLTLSSVLVWLNFFDVGLGNGLRNKFAKALAFGDKNSARVYASTTYAILGLIIVPIVLIFYAIFPFINWSYIFNAPPAYNNELNTLILFVMTFFGLQFILKVLSTILTAYQRPSLSTLIGTTGAFISFVFIYILTITTKGSLLLLGIAFSSGMLISLLFYSFVLYSTILKEYRPSIKYVNFKYAKSLFGMGVQFFVIQISAIVLFQTQNIIIAQLFGPKDVTPFNIAYRYFSMISMAFNIVITPFWSAYTDAYYKKDFEWIKSIVSKLIKIWSLFFLLDLFLLIISPFFYKVWIGNRVTIPFSYSLILFVYVSQLTFGSIFVYFLNGIGKVKVQLYYSLFTMVAYIPVSIFFSKHLSMGIPGLILASCLMNVYGFIIAPIQYYKIIYKKQVSSLAQG